ncbi:putative mitochondrial protein AtMg00310 [Castanea sativa]|uniref:putative mitochondrial protein AtMg00310 n=1 Tax=Castanea sativa TaxID=21020 RepID=UPI003F651FCD
MSYFKLPKGLIKELEIFIRKFWWGYNGDNRRVHWVKWESLWEEKEKGGMSFKNIEKFNDSLLAKQVWHMINNLDSLCHRVFKARFFPDRLILEAKESTIGSYAWKGILSARDVIRKGTVWRIGNGCSLRITEDRWLSVQTNRIVISRIPTMEPGTKVNTLINTETGEWNTLEVNQLFLPHKASMICGIPLSNRLPPD